MCSITEGVMHFPTGTLTILEQMLMSVAFRKLISSNIVFHPLLTWFIMHCVLTVISSFSATMLFVWMCETQLLSVVMVNNTELKHLPYLWKCLFSHKVNIIFSGKNRFWNQNCIWVLAMSLTSRLNLSEVFVLSEPQFTHLEMRVITSC